MKTAIALLLLLSAAMCVDVSRTNTHVLDSRFADNYTMRELFTGRFADGAAAQIAVNGFDYVQSRSALADIRSWSFNATNETLELDLNGFFPLATKKAADIYLLGGIGFTDDICVYPYGSIPAISQDITTKILLPDGVYVAKIPKNYSGQMDYIDFQLTNSQHGNELYQRLTMVLKQDAYAEDYCRDRAEVEKWLKEPFVVTNNPTIVALYHENTNVRPWIKIRDDDIGTITDIFIIMSMILVVGLAVAKVKR